MAYILGLKSSKAIGAALTASDNRLATHCISLCTILEQPYTVVVGNRAQVMVCERVVGYVREAVQCDLL